VHLALEPLSLALQPVALGPDLLQSPATLLKIRRSLGVRGSH
jgi:hypothetical protein